jgi:hypothetical protein
MTIRSAAGSYLLELDQGPAEIFGVQEQHRLVMGTETRLAITEHSCTLGAQPVSRGDDVIDLVANVVHAASRIAFKKTAHRRGVAERLEQLDPGVWQVDEDYCDAVRRQRARL